MVIPKEYETLILDKHIHVVILGAGASCASTPEDEKFHRKLPMMNQLPEILDLNDLLSDKEMKSAVEDFENFYSELVNKQIFQISNEIEHRLYDFFSTIDLSEDLSLYEKIIFSLRRKDVISTFNWDPLLGYAFRRNGDLGCLPHLLFLHGNVLLGVCERDKRLGWNDDVCDDCHERLQPTQLLYPVTNKNYENSSVIRNQWELLDFFLDKALFVTIFGYSAPMTDISARHRIIDKILNNTNKDTLQLEIIDLYPQRLIDGNLKELKENGIHFSLLDSFTRSYLNQYPKFTCEALKQSVLQQTPLTPIPYPDNDVLDEYRTWHSMLIERFPKFREEGNEKQG